jgi:5-methylcytosine-specific restriction endonuclease McrA
MSDRRCSACGQTFPETTEFFCARVSRPGKFYGRCRRCETTIVRAHQVALGDEHRRRARAEYRRNHDRHLVRGRARYAQHRRRLIAKSRAWNVANAERFRENVRRSHRKHHVKRSAYMRKWYAENPSRRWERRVGLAVGFCTREQLDARIAYYGHQCYRCFGPYDAIDHVIPLAKGGTNWPANLRPICRRCNSRKHTRRLSEMDDRAA